MDSILGIRKQLHATKLVTGDSHIHLSVLVYAVWEQGRNLFIYNIYIYIYRERERELLKLYKKRERELQEKGLPV
jgi:hypothetical protein